MSRCRWPGQPLPPPTGCRGSGRGNGSVGGGEAHKGAGMVWVGRPGQARKQPANGSSAQHRPWRMQACPSEASACSTLPHASAPPRPAPRTCATGWSAAACGRRAGKAGRAGTRSRGPGTLLGWPGSTQCPPLHGRRMGGGSGSSLEVLAAGSLEALLLLQIQGMQSCPIACCKAQCG